MKKFEAESPSDSTLLDPDEIQGLIPDYITTQRELNELEQKNILGAVIWSVGHRSGDLLSPKFVHELHRRMFGDVWRWAGSTRKTEKNIGIDPHQISSQLAQLLENTRYWIQHRTFSLDEAAARFHHRLVQIHVFPNGNGRHARLITELLLEEQGSHPFTWGRNSVKTSIDVEGSLRQNYISALKAADRGEFNALLAFVRS